MAHRIGRYTTWFDRPPTVEAAAAVAGPKEGQGPLGNRFDRVFTDPRLGKKSWEQAESELQRQAFLFALQKGGLKPEEVDCLFAGDLLNQCVGSTEGLLPFGLPQAGIYGACSTMALGLLLAAVACDGGMARRAAAVTSSHFCASERQFRLPLEYGGQRPQTAQWTATAAGAVVLGQPGEGVQVTAALLGRVREGGVTDANNMGAAMAPAAADVIVRFFNDTGLRPEEVDLIATGDLGETGSKLLCRLTAEAGLPIADRHADCGLNLYHKELQDVHAGGSGCGCSAAVLCARLLPELAEGVIKRLLFVATGSLHSPTTVQQKTPIPGIAHAVYFTAP